MVPKWYRNFKLHSAKKETPHFVRGILRKYLGIVVACHFKACPILPEVPKAVLKNHKSTTTYAYGQTTLGKKSFSLFCIKRIYTSEELLFLSFCCLFYIMGMVLVYRGQHVEKWEEKLGQKGAEFFMWELGTKGKKSIPIKVIEIILNWHLSQINLPFL